MRDNSTESFLRILEKQNAAIAAAEVRRRAQEKNQTDPIRLQREQERREQWGTLRAREHPSRRPKRTWRVFDYVDPS